MRFSVVVVPLLLGVFCVSSFVQAHIDIAVAACKTGDIDGEDALELDGDEMLYVDFDKKEVEITVPEFAGKWTAPGWAQQALANHQICLNNLDLNAEAEGNPPEAIDVPEATVYSRNKVVAGKENILICSAKNFFPPPVKVKWTKNNVEVTEGVTLSRYYPNKDFTFTQYSTLPFTPQEGDIYSCTVEHNGLNAPETKIWEPEFLGASDIGKTVYCGVGLTLGLLGVGVGTFFLIKGNNCN